MNIYKIFITTIAVITLANCNNKVEDDYLNTPEGKLEIAKKYISESIDMGAVAIFEDGISILDSLKNKYPNSPVGLSSDSILQKRDSLLNVVKVAYNNNLVRSQTQEPTFKKDEITTVLRIESEGIRIINKSFHTYTNVRLKLNDKYKAENITLSGNEDKIIYYNDFADDGKRFNVVLEKPESIYIAGEYNGEKYWGYYKVN